MSFKNSGFAFLPLILIIGLVVGIFTFYQFNLFEKFFQAKPSPLPAIVQTSQPSLTLTSSKEVNQLKPQETFTVDLIVSTEEAVNLIAAKIKYAPQVKLKKIIDLGDQQPTHIPFII